jgi:exopolysaccharide biosynthesis WecB/TagA/CpsF family protein
MPSPEMHGIPAASRTFAARLAELHGTDQGASVTWFNHYSVLADEWDVDDLGTADYIGVDGLFLRQLMNPHPPRTSADSVIPLFLADAHEARVLVLGGSPDIGPRVEQAITRLLPATGEVVAVFDGYGGLPDTETLSRRLAEIEPTVVIVGLGPLRQNAYLAHVTRQSASAVVLTCGGWLDQVIQEQYYPPWAYALRLNWAIRLWREPSRLWRRYTWHAMRAIVRRRRIATRLGGLTGYRAYVRLLSPRT